MSITIEDIEALAQTSCIVLDDEEKRAFPDQINEIIGYVDKLNELDTEGVKPTAFIHMLKAIEK
jgi:aspartyl-tRNA(Asn)/glutamyl-tRNA(Gln) amidotransferase subunit C